jgi:hypothetical protein
MVVGSSDAVIGSIARNTGESSDKIDLDVDFVAFGLWVTLNCRDGCKAAVT